MRSIGELLEDVRARREVLAVRQVEVHEDAYRRHFEECPDALVITDVRGVIREANAALAGMIAIRAPILVGKPLIHFVARADCRPFRGALETLRTTGKLEGFLMRIRPRHQGSPFYVEVNARGARHGADLFIRWVIRDVQARVTETMELVRRVREAEGLRDSERAPELPREDCAGPSDDSSYTA